MNIEAIYGGFLKKNRVPGTPKSSMFWDLSTINHPYHPFIDGIFHGFSMVIPSFFHETIPIQRAIFRGVPNDCGNLPGWALSKVIPQKELGKS
jgi:hypothetical protein